MRILADENFPKGLVNMLRVNGSDVLWDREDCRGWTDSTILEFAESEARIVLTLDKDFWQIAFSVGLHFSDLGLSYFVCTPQRPKISSLWPAPS